MWKKVLFLLGCIVFLSVHIATFESYSNVRIPSTLIILGLFLLVVITRISTQRTIYMPNKRLLLGYYFLFGSIVFPALLNNEGVFLEHPELFYSRALYPFVLLVVVYMLVRNLQFESFLRWAFVLNLVLAVLSFFWNVVQGNPGRPENVLVVSDRVAFLGIAVFNISSRKIDKLVVSVVTCLTLAVYLSLTSFIIFAVVIYLNVFYTNLTQGSTKVRFLILFGLILLVVFSISFVNSVANQVVVINGNGRLVDSINTILYRLHSVLNRSDASQMARSLMKDEGTRILMKKPLTGEFLYEIKCFGDSGSYIHNVLSYWAEFGLLAFALILGFVISAMWKNYRIFSLYQDSLAGGLLFSSLYMLLIFLFSRSYAHDLLWICLGATVSYSDKFTTDGKN